MSNVFMHRISHHFDISRALLDKKILTIGFNHQGIQDNENAGKWIDGNSAKKEMLRLATDGDPSGSAFGKYMKKIGYDSNRKWYLWYFCRICPGDLIGHPSVQRQIHGGGGRGGSKADH